ncbi:hypothetical protein BJ508DRAFT_419520 [Ascobolus immersus RN42]|uniref:Uncharacterized protein n=1 Tax=Ascobolus immersus RN42 TaxID=1160509 RepID=A0A3N4HJH8_ASCIM|nr:hypothetical protein BJ508DRAFT_419520 [Ascobolus immersus RN42]
MGSRNFLPLFFASTAFFSLLFWVHISEASAFGNVYAACASLIDPMGSGSWIR